MGECASHNDLVKTTAALEARLDGVESWVENIDTKLDRHHDTMSKGFEDINKTLNTWKGGGVAVIKIGGMVVGLMAVVVGVYHIAQDLLARGGAP